jgi:hypothetical protein
MSDRVIPEESDRLKSVRAGNIVSRHVLLAARPAYDPDMRTRWVNGFASGPT